MRVIKSGNPNTMIRVLDEPGQGGACHIYSIDPVNCSRDEVNKNFGKIYFQNGLVQEFGVNGCHQEDLLMVVIDRLQSFQNGPFSCRENALALTKCQEAMHWLNHRTALRQKN